MWFLLFTFKTVLENYMKFRRNSISIFFSEIIQICLKRTKKGAECCRFLKINLLKKGINIDLFQAFSVWYVFFWFLVRIWNGYCITLLTISVVVGSPQTSSGSGTGGKIPVRFHSNLNRFNRYFFYICAFRSSKQSVFFNCPYLV